MPAAMASTNDAASMGQHTSSLCLVGDANATLWASASAGNVTHSGLTCALDFAAISLNSLFVYVTVMIHMYLRICASPSAQPLGYPNPRLYPCHNLLWLLMLAQGLVSLCSVGELVLLYTGQGTVLPVSLVESAIGLVTAVLVPLYFDSVESRAFGTFVPLMVQFFGSAFILGLRAVQLPQFQFEAVHLRHWIIMSGLTVHVCLCLALLLGLAKRLFDLQTSIKHPYNSNRNLSKCPTAADTHAYLYNAASFFSKMTFGWMLPLLKQGYKTPLEIDDLQKLPAEEKARRHFEHFKKSSCRPERGILRACIFMNWQLILLGGIFRLLADLFGFVGALSIKFVVEAMSADFEALLVTSSNSTNSTLEGKETLNDDASCYKALTVEEFFSDTYVIAVIIFLSALGQGAFSQTSSHLLTVAGVRSKNALHVLLYDKSLRLPVGTTQKSNMISDAMAAAAAAMCINPCNATGSDSVCPPKGGNDKVEDDDDGTNEGNIDIGFITNLASEDILNIRELIWNIHYLWALPLKVLVLIGLLYQKMGVSGAVGVVLGTLVIVPLQFLIGKLMSDNNKRIFAAQDVRLYKSTETMQGMKTVKLNCLEEAQLAKIEAARNSELTFLRRDSFFWSVMAFLASVSTIIVSTVTVGLYVALEENTFSAANIFSALALLGQLTVCLSVFPVTIVVLVSSQHPPFEVGEGLDFINRTEFQRSKQLPGQNKIINCIL